LVALVSLCSASAPTPAQADSVASLSALKAAYTLHFVNLIQWEAPESWLDFCVAGQSETGDRILGTLNNKTVHGQNIVARQLSRDRENEHCDALYIPAGLALVTPALLKRYERENTVTISDAPGFAEDGGVIGFVIVDERLRFDINEAVAVKRRLKISAKLLELARSVIRS
jgi:hypothetical protein